MATTPIVEIPVDDSAFQRFAKAYGDYQDKLKEQPKLWQDTNERITQFARLQQAAGVNADKAWANATQAAREYEKSIASATKAEKHLGGGLTGAASAMRKMAADGKSLAGHMFGAVKFATKLASFGLGGSLIGLAAGGFGLDALAGNVLETQKTARGLGLTSGQLNSFRVNMQGIAGTNVLQGAAEAQRDLNKQGWLATLGISPVMAQHESATKLAQQEIMAVHRAWKQNPTLQSAGARAGMALGMSWEDVQRIGRTSAKTLQARGFAVGRDAGALGFSDQVAREWSAFKIAMDKAGKLIETALINTLTPLTPQLTKLSREIANMIVGLEKSGEVKKWVGDTADALKTFANWLGSPNFQQDMRTIAYYFDAIAHGVAGVAKKFGISVPPAPGMNNPFNIMVAGKKQLAGYASEAQGVAAPYKLYEAYATQHHLSTVGAMLARFKGPWAGKGDMTTAQYVNYITKNAGIGANAMMPFTDTKEMAKILHFQSIAEGHAISETDILADIRKMGVAGAYKALEPRYGYGPGSQTQAHAQVLATTQRQRDAAVAEAAERRAAAQRAMPHKAATEPQHAAAGAGGAGDLSTVMRKLRRQHPQKPTVNLHIQNQTGAEVHMSANAAIAY